MESQPQNPEFRDNPENFHPCIKSSWDIPSTYEIFSKDGNVALQLLHDHLKYSSSPSIWRENRCFGTFAHSI